MLDRQICGGVRTTLCVSCSLRTGSVSLETPVGLSPERMLHRMEPILGATQSAAFDDRAWFLFVDSICVSTQCPVVPHPDLCAAESLSGADFQECYFVAVTGSGKKHGREQRNYISLKTSEQTPAAAERDSRNARAMLVYDQFLDQVIDFFPKMHFSRESR